jgi:multiple sugar transport system permease protein
MHGLNDLTSRKNRGEHRKGLDRDRYWGYLFIAPEVLGAVCFMFLPAIFSIFLAFWNWDFVKTPLYIGLNNFKNVLKDPFTVTILKNTLYFMLLFIPATLVTSTALALLLNANIKGRLFFRFVFFLPTVTGTVAISLVWTWMYSKDFGLFNGIIYQLLGRNGPNWLGDPKISMMSIALVAIWRATCYQAIIVLAGLTNIPVSYTEAARIDGATPLQVFFRIKLPLLTPTFFFVSTILLIGAVQIFNEPFIMTQGGPANSTMTLMLHIYNTAFVYFHFGKTAVYSLILFIISITLTILHFRGQKGWVNYNVE